jgi:hypothetical protein
MEAQIEYKSALIATIEGKCYAHTIGMPRFGCPELVAAGSPRVTTEVLHTTSVAICTGKLDWKQMKKESKFTHPVSGIPLRVRVMEKSIRDKYVGLSLDPTFGLLQPDYALAIVRPDSSSGQFDDFDVMAQLSVMGIPQNLPPEPRTSPSSSPNS